MNKRHFIIRTMQLALSAVAVAALPACEKFLAETEQPRLTVDYYNTQQGIDAAGVAAYGYMRYGVGVECTNLLTELGTDIFTGNTGGVSKPSDKYDGTLSSTWGNLYSFWTNHYKAINTTNLAIEGITGSSVLNDSQKSAGLAEMRFLRAYFYFDLVQQFGSIPLMTKAEYSVRTTAERSPISSIYNLIISDLRYAEENLRETATGNERGKATRYAAAHLLAKAYLTRGSAVTDQRGQKPTDIDSCYHYANRVISSDRYSLIRNYADLWNQNNQNNAEVIFAVQFTSNLTYDGGGNLQHLYWNSGYESVPGMIRDLENGRPYNFHRLTNWAVDNLYDRKNDSRFYKSFVWVRYANYAPSLAPGMQLGDTAIYIGLKPKSAVTGLPTRYNVTYSQWNYDDPNSNPRMPALVKYFDRNRLQVNQTQGSREWVRMRLGETYLLAAEALGRKGDYEGAAKLINVLRERAAWHDGEPKYSQYWREEGGERGDTSDTFPLIEVTAADLQTDFVGFILDERARELLGELMRWEDLVRCEKLYELVKARNNGVGHPNIQPYHKLRPIPQNHIDRLFPQPDDLTKEQNEGYF